MMTLTIAVQCTINRRNRVINNGWLTCMLNLVCAPVRARLFQVFEAFRGRAEADVEPLLRAYGLA